MVPADTDTVYSAVADFLATGFDVTVDIPFRARVFALGRDEHLAVLVVHHIAADGASTVPLARDLLGAYQARSRNEAPHLDTAARPVPRLHAVATRPAR